MANGNHHQQRSIVAGGGYCLALDLVMLHHLYSVGTPSRVVLPFPSCMRSFLMMYADVGLLGAG